MSADAENPADLLHSHLLHTAPCALYLKPTGRPYAAKGCRCEHPVLYTGSADTGETAPTTCASAAVSASTSTTTAPPTSFGMEAEELTVAQSENTTNTTAVSSKGDAVRSSTHDYTTGEVYSVHTHTTTTTSAAGAITTTANTAAVASKGDAVRSTQDYTTGKVYSVHTHTTATTSAAGAINTTNNSTPAVCTQGKDTFTAAESSAAPAPPVCAEEEEDNVVVLDSSAPVQFLADCAGIKAPKHADTTLACDRIQVPASTPIPTPTAATDAHCDVPPRCLPPSNTNQAACPPPSTHGSCEVGGSREEPATQERVKAQGLTGKIKRFCRSAAGVKKHVSAFLRIVLK